MRSSSTNAAKHGAGHHIVASFVLQSTFLLGRQVRFGHELPTQRRSTTTVRCPAWAMCHDTAEDEDGYATRKLSALCAHDQQLLGDKGYCMVMTLAEPDTDIASPQT
jgi:hypothetical protein